MGYIDLRPNLLVSSPLHGSYRRQRDDLSDYDDNLHTRHCSIASMAFGATMLLYDCLTYGGCLAHYCVSVCGQEKLHTEMAEAIGILLLSPCAGFRQGPIGRNYMDQASSSYVRTMLVGI